ncbi:hypothetical protein FIBSPDRAFT_741208, partial [Athelia psychrophila]
MWGAASAYRPRFAGAETNTFSGIHSLPYAPAFRNENRTTGQERSPSESTASEPGSRPKYGDGFSGAGGPGGDPPRKHYPLDGPSGTGGKAPGSPNRGAGGYYGPPGGGGRGPPGGGYGPPGGGYGPPGGGNGPPGGGGYGPPGGGGYGPPGGGYGPPGGGGNGPPGGGGNGPPGGGTGPPYGPPGNNWNMPSIKTELKPEQLPTWDGQYDSAIQYFYEIQEFAALGGNIPQKMGFWLWKQFEKNSPVADWYAGLTSDLKAHMRAHYSNFIDTIQRYYLGSEWKQYIQLKYENQRFRQSGREKETPHQFIMRRILYTRMLLQVPPDSPAEVYYICAKNPVSWASLLNRDNIPDTAALQLRTRELHEALVDSWGKANGGKAVTQDNLVSMLQRAGITVTSTKPTYRPYRQSQKQEPSTTATAYLVEAADENPEDEVEALPNDDSIVHQAYATMQRQPPPSRRGPFPFDKCDHVHTTLGKRPAWPCRACGSSNHWDKECPMWDRFQAKVKKAMWVEKDDPNEDRTVYTQVYVALLENVEDSAYVESEAVQKLSLRVSAQLIDLSNAHRVEEIEDESELHRRVKEGFLAGQEYDMVPDSDALPGQASNYHASNREGRDPPVSTKTSSSEGLLPGEPSTEEVGSNMPPPPKEAPTFKVAKKKRTAPGLAAMDTSVLSIRGKLGSMEERTIDLRLDSGADVSLISKEFLQSLKNKVPIHKGVKMRLWQLTDRNSCLEGYVTIPVFTESEDGTMLESELEAYVVPGMSVDVLLGEDYQLSHEVTVARDLEKGSRISYRSYRSCPHHVQAVAVGRTKDFDRMTPSHVSHVSYVRAKQHRRAQARKFRKRRKFGEEMKTIRALTDLKIAPNSVASLPVEGYFDEEKEWLVEKSLLANADDSFFAIPNVLFSASYPVVPIMNPTDRPRFIRKGEAVGLITDPSKFLDTPQSPSQHAKMEEHASCLAAMVQSMMEKDEAAKAEANSTEKAAEKDRPAADPSPKVEINETAALLAGNTEDSGTDKDSWGPKTAEMPDPTEYSSEDMERLLDVGSLPEELREKAWAMLKRRVNAFAFDGRLGHHSSKVHIRTVEGQAPIAVPM